MNFTVTPSLFVNNPLVCANNSIKKYNNVCVEADKTGYNNTNIRGLACDTVSFGQGKTKIIKETAKAVGNKLRADKVAPDTKIADVNYKLAITLEKEADIPLNYMKTTLKRYLGKLVSVDSHEDRPIYDLVFGIKNRDSIAEKIESIAKKFMPEESEEGHLVTITKEMAKQEIGDIPRARIVLRDGSKDSVKEVLEALSEGVRDGKLVFTEIENYRPIVPEVPSEMIKRFQKDLGVELDKKNIQKIISDPDYFAYPRSVDLAKFKQVCQKRYRDIEVKDRDLPTGYPAIHLAVKLPNGYTGEIQIIGRDVEALKEIEDFYYKAKCKKTIKYAPLAKRLEPLRDEKDYFLHDAMLDYTRWAYIGQRLKGEVSHTKKISSKFLVADAYLLDKQLGFNQNASLCAAASKQRKTK